MHATQNTPSQTDVIPKTKYEMNLAEFPLALLSKRQRNDVDIIEYTDSIIGKNGKEIPRTWRVKPSVEFGFGNTLMTATLFELFQIWKEQDFKSRNIQFGNIHNLIVRMGIQDTDTAAYNRIRDNLNALTEITVNAKNAFWDNVKKAYETKNFHLFVSVSFYHRNPDEPYQDTLPFSYIKASEELFGSIAANALVTLKGVDRELFYSLTPTEQRLGLYLSKRLHKDNEHRRDVEALASQMPIISPLYKNKKRQMTRACEGLIKKNFPYLTSYRFEPSQRARRDNIIFRKENHAVATDTKLTDDEAKAKRDILVEDIIAVTREPHRRAFYESAVAAFPQQAILTCLSITKGEKNEGGIRKSAHSLFYTLLMDYARKNTVKFS